MKEKERSPSTLSAKKQGNRRPAGLNEPAARRVNAFLYRLRAASSSLSISPESDATFASTFLSYVFIMDRMALSTGAQIFSFADPENPFFLYFQPRSQMRTLKRYCFAFARPQHNHPPCVFSGLGRGRARTCHGDKACTGIAFSWANCWEPIDRLLTIASKAIPREAGPPSREWHGLMTYTAPAR